jgi:hypothetical protein
VSKRLPKGNEVGQSSNNPNNSSITQAPSIQYLIFSSIPVQETISIPLYTTTKAKQFIMKFSAPFLAGLFFSSTITAGPVPSKCTGPPSDTRYVNHHNGHFPGHHGPGNHTNPHFGHHIIKRQDGARYDVKFSGQMTPVGTMSAHDVFDHSKAFCDATGCIPGASEVRETSVNTNGGANQQAEMVPLTTTYEGTYDNKFGGDWNERNARKYYF